jgi:hypothetical protein
MLAVSGCSSQQLTTGDIMRFVGFLATALAAASALGAIVLTVQSLPDIRRYLRIARM